MLGHKVHVCLYALAVSIKVEGSGSYLSGVPAEFLAQCERRGVLSVRSADLDDVRELLSLRIQCRLQSTA